MEDHERTRASNSCIAAVVAHHDEVERITRDLLLGRMRSRIGRHKVLAVEVFGKAALNLIYEKCCERQNRYQGCRHTGQGHRQYPATLGGLGSGLSLCGAWLPLEPGLGA